MVEGLATSKDELNEKLRNMIVLESFSVKPIFSSYWKRIHPAIDVVDGVAYVGVDLPCEVTNDKGKMKLMEFHFLIGSDGSRILCHKEELTKHKIQLSHSVVRMPNRWSLESVKSWLDGTAHVEPQETYTAVKTAFETYIEFEDPVVYDFLTLWTIGTYFFHLFNAYPYLYIGGTKQVGKTKLLTVLSLMCHNAIFSGNISTSSAFRLIQSGRCTLLMDETEKLNNPERETDFRNMLLNGYKKGGVVYRTHKDTLKPEPFEVYSPKALANIRGVEDVLEDRCISIIMKRGRNANIVNVEVPLNSDVWQRIRDMLYIFYLTHYSELCELSEHSELCGEPLKQRELELWKPIFVLARFFDNYIEGLYASIHQFALKKAEEKFIENMTETFDLILVQTLSKLVTENGYYKVKDIKDEMAKNFDEPQKWLTTKWVGNALRRLGFTEKRRFGTGYEYALTVEKVEDLIQRLGIAKKTPSLQSSQSSENSLSSLTPNIQEVYRVLREQLTEPFYDYTAIEIIRQMRSCTFEEAEKLFQIFIDEGRLVKNPYGLYEWIN